MTRKHFVAIARAIAMIDCPGTRDHLALLMADICADSNPNFDRTRFLRACEVS